MGLGITPVGTQPNTGVDVHPTAEYYVFNLSFSTSVCDSTTNLVFFLFKYKVENYG